MNIHLRIVIGLLFFAANSVGLADAVEEAHNSRESTRDSLLAQSECLIQSGDLSFAENLLRKFIQEYPKDPTLPLAFAKLNEIYDRENGSSSVDLNHWAEDNDYPFRAGFARFYYACNELRISRTENALRLFQEFIRDLAFHPLVNKARLILAEQYLNAHKAQNALDVLAGSQSDENKKEFDILRGRVLFLLNRYTGAANAFLSAAQQDTSPQAEALLYNAALSHLLAGAPLHSAQAELLRRYPKGQSLQELQLIEALQKAKFKHPHAIQALQALANTSLRARLALSEIYFAANDRKNAIAHWNEFASNSKLCSDRAIYLAVFLADNKSDQCIENVIRLAQGFLDSYPRSPFKSEIEMKLGEVYFRSGNFLAARTHFESLAREFPDSPLAEIALFFAGQSSIRMMDASEIENAMLFFEEVAKSNGRFAMQARLEQAQLQQNIGHLDQALLILKNILSSLINEDIQFEALIMQGNIYFSQGGAENYTQAIKSWQKISSHPNLTLPWKNQALTKIGAAYQRLGNNKQALASYYAAINTVHDSVPEFFWIYKAGFDAGKLLEAQQAWKESIDVYKKIASLSGPRAQEAQDRIKYLEAKNLLESK